MTTNRPSRAMPATDQWGNPARPQRLAVLTYRQVAEIVGVHWTAVQQAEDRAFAKLASDPDAKKLFSEMINDG